MSLNANKNRHLLSFSLAPLGSASTCHKTLCNPPHSLCTLLSTTGKKFCLFTHLLSSTDQVSWFRAVSQNKLHTSFPSSLLEPVLKVQNLISCINRTDSWGYKDHKVIPGHQGSISHISLLAFWLIVVGFVRVVFNLLWVLLALCGWLVGLFLFVCLFMGVGWLGLVLVLIFDLWFWRALGFFRVFFFC